MNRDFFLIGDIGVNYYDIAKKNDISNMEAAKLMIQEAKNAGLDAIKFQTYKAHKIASRNSPAYWDTKEEPTASQYELFKKFDSFNEQEYRELYNFCRDINIKFLSTPFDFESANYLEDMMDIYKISSSDLNNIPFIKHIALKNKKIYLSTGASTMEEIKKAIEVCETAGNSNLCIMHCVLSYPTKFDDANLLMIKHLKDEFGDKYEIGYSDHTKPDKNMLVLTTAYLYGATIIEKHYTINKTLKGNDHYHSMDTDDIIKIKNNISFIKTISGKYNKNVLPCEKESRKQARRSIVALKNMDTGHIISKNDVTFKRPGTGIPPSEISNILGKRVVTTIKEDDLISYNHII